MHTEENERLILAVRAAGRRLTKRRSLRDLEQALGQIVSAAVATVGAVDAGSISLARHGSVETRHATTDRIRKLDTTQAELREGPCIAAIEDPPRSGILVVGDLAGPEGDQWPRYAPLVVEAGYRGLMSVSLSSGDDVAAALNLYAAAPDAFADRDRVLGGSFGIQAGLLLFGSNEASDRQRAADTRDLIGQARGVLRERFAVDDETAFHMLVRSSRDTGIELVDVARWVTTPRSRAARPDGDLV